jgi:hypothetical protein
MTSSSDTSSQIQFNAEDQLRGLKFSPRSAPAKVTTESKDTLERNGYVRIGWISVVKVVKTCWNNKCNASFKCESVSPQEDYTKSIIELAPQYGGDLIVLVQDRSARVRDRQKVGKCTHHLKDFNSEGRVILWVCDAWATDYGNDCVNESQWDIWRLNKDHEIDYELEKYRQQRARNKEKYLALKSTYEANYQRTMVGNRDDLSGPGPFSIKVGGKYGFTDKNSEDKNRRIVIEPQFTDCVAPYFNEGLQAVAIGNGNNRLWGYIDKTGNWVIRPSYKEASQFYDGLASVKVNDKIGFINKQGNFVIEPQFDITWSFIDGIAKVKVDLKIGYVNKAGEVILEP